MLGTALAGIIYIAATRLSLDVPSFRYGLFPARAVRYQYFHDSGGYCAAGFRLYRFRLPDVLASDVMLVGVSLRRQRRQLPENLRR